MALEYANVFFKTLLIKKTCYLCYQILYIMISQTIFLAIGPWQIVLVVLVVLLLFGGKKIPELMRGLGSGLKEFKDASKDEDKTTPTNTPNTNSTGNTNENPKF